MTTSGRAVQQQLVAIGEGELYTVNVVPSATCQNLYYPMFGTDVNITFTKYGNFVMCAGNLQRDGIDTCNGDSGGTLLIAALVATNGVSGCAAVETNRIYK
jgi:secreted trypsin-like serine protease